MVVTMAVGYQLQFLSLLDRHDVTHIVVGGAVRNDRGLHEGHDLDIWLRLAVGDAPKIRRAFSEWRSKYAFHFNLLTDEIPIAAGGRYLFPAFDESVNYEESPGIWRSVSIKDGVDVLIGVEAVPSFDECYSRAAIRELGPNLRTRSLHPDDDKRLPNLRDEIRK
jgi:hypothetical protein